MENSIRRFVVGLLINDMVTNLFDPWKWTNVHFAFVLTLSAGMESINAPFNETVSVGVEIIMDFVYSFCCPLCVTYVLIGM